jgi:hypothetical protein
MNKFLNNLLLEVKNIFFKKLINLKLIDVNFIAELINNKILSKKIVFQCIEHLISKPDILKLEGVVILIDKFGTFINITEANRIKEVEKKEFNSKLDEYLSKLNKMQEEDIKMPGYLRYKIINLMDKRDRKWEESMVDKTIKIKSKKDVEDEMSKEMKETGEVQSYVSSGKKNVDIEAVIYYLIIIIKFSYV